MNYQDLYDIEKLQREVLKIRMKAEAARKLEEFQRNKYVSPSK